MISKSKPRPNVSMHATSSRLVDFLQPLENAFDIKDEGQTKRSICGLNSINTPPSVSSLCDSIKETSKLLITTSAVSISL